MSDIDTAALREAALAATPGPWSAEVTDGDIWTAGNRERIAKTASYFYSWDAAYIAAVSPDVVLALLDEVEALRGQAQSAQAVIAKVLHLHGIYAGMRAKNADVRRGADAVLSAVMAVMTEDTPTDTAPTAQVGAEGRGEGL